MADYQAFKIEGLDGVLKSLQELPKEVSQKRGGPVRTALRKGANLIRNEARANVRRITDAPNVGGGDKSTGLLEKSISVVRGRQHATLNGERMFVLVPRRRRYPIDARTTSGIAVVTIGRMLEYGTSKMPAHKWMGPAFHAKKGEAVTTIVTELRKGIDRIVAKLARENRK